MTSLIQLGWNVFFDRHFKSFQEQGFAVGRIAIENRDNYLVLTEGSEYTGEVTGKLLFNARFSADLPKVGDWVVVSLFERKRLAVRKPQRLLVLTRQAHSLRKYESRVLPWSHRSAPSWKAGRVRPDGFRREPSRRVLPYFTAQEAEVSNLLEGDGRRRHVGLPLVVELRVVELDPGHDARERDHVRPHEEYTRWPVASDWVISLLGITQAKQKHTVSMQLLERQGTTAIPPQFERY